MNKTIITCCAMVCATALLAILGVVGLYLKLRPAVSLSVKSEFTDCVATLMSESRQSGKVIDAKEASELCKNFKAKN